MEAIGGFFSFLGHIVDQRTMVISEIIKHAATRWVTWSASVINLVYEFWQQGKTSSANFENIVGADDSLRSPGIVQKILPTTHEEDTVDVLNAKEDVGDKEDTSTVATKTKRGRSRTRRPRRQSTNGGGGGGPTPPTTEGKSSKRKSAKDRATYTLRGVAGEVAKPARA